MGTYLLAIFTFTGQHDKPVGPGCPGRLKKGGVMSVHIAKGGS